MLRSIHLRNFKRYGEEGARFTLAPVTLLLGPNSAGKSTLLQALLLLKQSWESDSASLTSLLHLDLQGPLVDLGHSRNVVHRHDESRVIEIELETSGGRCNLSYLGDNSSPRLKLLSIEIFAANLSQGVAPSQQPGPTDGSPELRLSVADGKLVLDRACALYQRLWALARADGGLQREHCLTLELEALEWRLALSTLPADRAEPSQKGDESADPDDIQSTSAVEGQMIASRQFWEAVGGAGFSEVARYLKATLFDVRDQILAVSHVGAARLPCDRVFRPDSRPLDAVGSRGERTAHVLSDGDVRRAVNRSLEFIGIPYEASVRRYEGTASLGEITLLECSIPPRREGPDAQRTRVEVSVGDVGFGIGQLLPVLTEHHRLRQRAGRAGALLLEQPELHLHPACQSAVATLLAGLDRAKDEGNSSGDLQVISETHSEHMVLRLARHVRRGDLKADDVSLIFVRRDGVPIRVPLDERGDFDFPWPEGFFQERLDELSDDPVIGPTR